MIIFPRDSLLTRGSGTIEFHRTLTNNWFQVKKNLVLKQLGPGPLPFPPGLLQELCFFHKGSHWGSPTSCFPHPSEVSFGELHLQKTRPEVKAPSMVELSQWLRLPTAHGPFWCAATTFAAYTKSGIKLVFQWWAGSRNGNSWFLLPHLLFLSSPNGIKCVRLWACKGVSRT